MTRKFTVSALQPGQPTPAKSTGEGADFSPPLEWSDVPAVAKSLALICDDPDAPVGTWVHWVLYDLPVTATDLAEKVPPLESLSFGAKQGINDFKRVGYGGAGPPPREQHRYFLKIYSLVVHIGLLSRLTTPEILTALDGYI